MPYYQSVAPIVAVNQKKTVENHTPPPPSSFQSSEVVAKSNGCMFNYSSNEFYGYYYLGSGEPMYVNSSYFSSATYIPTDSIMFTDFKYYPCFCVKIDGTSNIRWFGSRTDLIDAIPYCNFIIPGAHPLVFNSQCVFNTTVNDVEPSKAGKPSIICNVASPGTSDRVNLAIGSLSATVRTLLGHKSNYTYLMVSTDSSLSMKVAANLMFDLDCDYAVSLDSSLPVELRIKNGFGASGKVTSNSGGVLMPCCICAYIKNYSIYDINRDGLVTLADVDIVSRNIGKTITSTSTDFEKRSDVNNDGIVDFNDLMIVIAAYEATL